MTRLRTRRSLALVCVALAVFAAFTPATSDLFVAVLPTTWVVAPVAEFVLIRRLVARCDEQLASLLLLSLSRAPPTSQVPA